MQSVLARYVARHVLLDAHQEQREKNHVRTSRKSGHQRATQLHLDTLVIAGWQCTRARRTVRMVSLVR